MTPVWTERHTAVGFTFAVGFLATLAGASEPWPQSVFVAAVVALVAVLSLATDVFGGLVLGLAGAAALVVVKRLTGDWDSSIFWPSLVETVALLAVGGMAGRTGRGLGAPGGSTPAPTAHVTPLAPVYGSLGLLPAHIALARLDEEVERARVHRRPLTLVMFATTITDVALDPEAREAALRAVARLVESQVRVIDVPFAVSVDQVGVILPETSWRDAWDLVGPIVDAINRAHFVVRREDRTRPLCEAILVDVGISSSSESTANGQRLLDDAAMAAGRNGDGAENLRGAS